MSSEIWESLNPSVDSIKPYLWELVNRYGEGIDELLRKGDVLSSKGIKEFRKPVYNNGNTTYQTTLGLVNFVRGLIIEETDKSWDLYVKQTLYQIDRTSKSRRWRNSLVIRHSEWPTNLEYVWTFGSYAVDGICVSNQVLKGNGLQEDFDKLIAYPEAFRVAVECYGIARWFNERNPKIIDSDFVPMHPDHPDRIIGRALYLINGVRYLVCTDGSSGRVYILDSNRSYLCSQAHNQRCRMEIRFINTNKNKHLPAAELSESVGESYIWAQV